MTTAQKIIKYIATAFALFLVVSIISAVLSAGYGILNSIGLIRTKDNIITEDLKVISNDVKEVSTLKIDLACTNLDIKVGDNFKVETNNSKITFEENNGNAQIKEKNKNWLNNNNSSSNLIVYIPETIQNLYLELGAGDVHIENIVVTQQIEINGGVGKTDLKSCKINNLQANLGMGEFSFYGEITGKNTISSGIGEVKLNLINNKEDYTIDVSKGIGTVVLDGENVESDRKYGNGENYLDIDGGIGDININFEK